MLSIRNLIFWTLLLSVSIWTHLRWEAESEFPVFKGESGLPAWDWICWKQETSGLKAVHVYKTAMNTPGNGIQPGDILQQIEYKPVPDASVLADIHKTSAPGKILIYKILRDEGNSFVPRPLNFFVSLSYYPFYATPQIPLIWNIQVSLAIILAFFSLLILLILYPFLKTSLLRNAPVMAVAVLTLLVFLNFILRDLRIRLEFPAPLIFQEQIFSCLWPILCGGIVLSALYALPRTSTRFWLLPSLLCIILFTGKIYQSVFIAEDFREHSENILAYTLFFTSLHILWFVLSERESGPVRDSVWIRLSGVIYLSILLVFSLLISAGIPLAENLKGLTELLSFPALSLPILDLSASRLKFGKTTVVLTRTIQYLLFAAAVLILYLLIDWVLNRLYSGAPYLDIVKLMIVIIFVLLFRALYHRNKNKLLKLGISFQQKQAEELQSFLALIPRYTHSHELLEDTQQQILKYFGSGRVEFWLDGIKEEDHDETLKAIYTSLPGPEIYWSANKELSPLTLAPDLENYLLSQNWSLVLPLRFSSGKAGLLLLARKKSGVYNLEDLDLLRRLNTQVWLTLDILYLLENEKMLMQKTMEANLTALRSQINPHFLFNTLNTIAALIHDNPAMAEMAVENLAFIFRYTLRTSGENFATVGNEMALVSKYLEIEKFRFGDNLEVNIHISDRCKDMEIPALVIQTIVENCIKHGITKIVGKGIVSIDVKEKDGNMVAIIEDNGPGIRSDRILKGTGLNNIHSRLYSLYDSQDMLTFENTGNGTRVTLTLPSKPHEK